MFWTSQPRRHVWRAPKLRHLERGDFCLPNQEPRVYIIPLHCCTKTRNHSHNSSTFTSSMIMSIFFAVLEFLIKQIFNFLPLFIILGFYQYLRSEPSALVAMASRSEPYEPSINDVFVVKATLRTIHKKSPLPLELIDTIIDFAEYWPHTTTTRRGGTLRLSSGTFRENKFLVNSILPLYFFANAM